MDTPLEESFAALTRPDAIVVARGVVATHRAEMRVSFRARVASNMIGTFASYGFPLHDVSAVQKKEVVGKLIYIQLLRG